MMNYLIPDEMNAGTAYVHYKIALYMDISMEVLAAAKRRMELAYRLEDANCDRNKPENIGDNSPIYQYWYWRFDCDEKVTA